jgi:hypothetical protein
MEAGDMPDKGTIRRELSDLARETAIKVKFREDLLNFFNSHVKFGNISIKFFKTSFQDFFWGKIDESILNKTFNEMDRSLVSWKLDNLNNEEKIAIVQKAFEDSSLYQWFQESVFKEIKTTIEKNNKLIEKYNKISGFKDVDRMRGLDNFDLCFSQYFARAYINKRNQQK